VSGGNSGHYQRLNLHHRIQHGLIALSVIMLIMTGFPLKYPELGFSHAMALLFGGAYGSAMVHRFFGLMMSVAVAYHILYLIYRYFRGARSWEMIPTFRDVKEAYETLLYWLTIRPTLPRFGRYSFLEKLEYLGVGFGASIMVLTGIALWFPVYSTRILPNWVMELSFRAHSQEALLAATVIFLWHFYFVHLSPVEFPMNRSFLDGKYSIEHLRLNHPREYEQLYGEEVPDSERAPHVSRLTPSVWRAMVYGGLATIALSIVSSWLLAGRVLERSEPNAPITAEIFTVRVITPRPHAKDKGDTESAEGSALWSLSGVRCTDCHKPPIEGNGKVNFNHFLHTELKVGCTECHAVGHHDSAKLIGGPAACFRCHVERVPQIQFNCSKCHSSFDDSQPLPYSHTELLD
jgi:formate dehydrogenase subunit gamma